MSSSLKTVAHIGFGAFHRAHQLAYAQELEISEPGGWNYCAISLNSSRDIELLKSQNFRFAVLEQDAQRQRVVEVNCVAEAMHPQLDGIAAIVDRLACDDVAIITLTVTEKGYCVKPGTAELDWSLLDLQHDLEEPDQPKTAIGLLVESLRRRRAAKRPGLAILSCDNLRGNSALLKTAVLSFAEIIDSELASWIKTHVSFPCSMIDRIVPAMNAASRSVLEKACGGVDGVGVVTESFKQWVIEDNFIQGRPAWEKVGVQLVEDVGPFEEMKLRMLNGAHSCMAYLGALAGFTTVNEVVADTDFQRLIRYFMRNEQAPSLNNIPVTLTEGYAEELMLRFANPHLQHRLTQIAMDGSQKLPQRFFAAIEDNIAAGRSFTIAALAVAAWIRYVLGVDEQGTCYQVVDPLFPDFQAVYAASGLAVGSAEKILQHKKIFPQSLWDNPAFVSEVCAAYRQICDNGAKRTVGNVSRMLFQ